MNNAGFFHQYVEQCRSIGIAPIVQPRMGFSQINEMLAGLQAVKGIQGARIGTITLDAMSRQRMWREAEEAVKTGTRLNGYPIVAHGAATTRSMLDGVQDANFPVQVRHGSPLPERVFVVADEAGLDAIEGGPISYCLPYGRQSLEECVSAWSKATTFWAEAGQSRGAINHIESFAGCMMGQLNPPDLLVALSIIEGKFFADLGIRSLSLSHSQGTNLSQDIGAVIALRKLAEEYLPINVSWHVVLYTWMGLFPESQEGARRLIEDSGVIAAITKAERIIVKTVVEAFQIPTVVDNVRALNWVAASAQQARGLQPNSNALEHAEIVYRQAKGIIEAVLNLDHSLDRSIIKAFQLGILDVPFCFHPDNKNEARAALDPRTGIIGWGRTGRIPVQKSGTKGSSSFVTADLLLSSLAFNKNKYDRPHTGTDTY